MRRSTRSIPTPPSRQRSLAGHRVLLKGGLGIGSRGSQGALLALAVRFLPPVQASDLAVGLAIAAAVNLFTNVGVPTLIVRHRRQGDDHRLLADLGRAYVVLTLFGGLLASAVCCALTASLEMTVLCGFLCVSQSAFYGLEYWSMGKGPHDYDAFLRRCNLVQTAVSVLSPLALFVTGSSTVGMLVLSGSFVAGVFAYRHCRTFRSALTHRGPTLICRWWRDAVGIGLASCAAATVYAADVVVLKLTATPGVVADYRLAIMCVSFTVALLPLSLFALADAASGFLTSLRLVLIVAVMYVIGVLALAWALSMWGGVDFAMVAQFLKILAPLAAFRLITQVMVSELNAYGRQGWVAAAFKTGIALWVLVGIYAGQRNPPTMFFCAAQSLIEFGIMIFLLWPWAKVRRDVGQRYKVST